MSEYALTADDQGVIRTEDGAYVPNDEGNYDWVAYQAWLADGGVPDPYVPPAPTAPAPTAGEELAFDHENRIRALEGQPPLTQEEFAAQMKR